MRVRVPATSANLGPGFDALGLALGRYDLVEVRALANNDVVVHVSGEGAGEVPSDASHLVVRALRAALETVGAPQTGLELYCENRIPHGRGLGSSAAAVVAGIMAARALVADPAALDDQTALRIATDFEGHPDNAAPAILGGATIAWESEVPGRQGATAVRLEVDPRIEVTALVPVARLATSHARGVLPAMVPHADAAFNAGRSALLIEALTRRPELLWEATADRLHQDYRASVMTASAQVVLALRTQGLAAVVSGAGPTVLVFTTAAERDRLEAAFVDLFGGARDWAIIRPGVDTQGAVAERLTSGSRRS